MRSLFVFALALVAAGCLRSTEYRCQSDTACGASGSCEATGYCSFADPDCASGRRYNESAGSIAGTCTSGGGPQDDASTTTTDGSGSADAMSADAVVAACPSGYVTLTGGQPGHLYRLLTAPDSWSAQEATCQLTTAQAHLVVPDDGPELDALNTLAGNAPYWVGITDAATEGTWLNTLGATQTFLPWASGSPNPSNNNQDDCVLALGSLDTIDDDRCTTNLPAICECAP